MFLSDVPVLGPDAENAARRFISLVDEFYDRAVKLIVSAAAPVTELYRGSKLTFEFERTKSRLIEMQSQEYLSTPASGVGAAATAELRLGARLRAFQRSRRAGAVAVQIHRARRQLPVERARRLELRAFRNQSARKPVADRARSAASTSVR